MALMDIYGGNLQRAERRLNAAEASYAEQGNEVGRHEVALARGQLHKFRGLNDESLEVTRKSLEFFLECSMYFHAAAAYSNLGHVHAIEERDPEACAYFSKAISTYEKGRSVNPRGEIPFYSGAGDFLTQMQSFREQLGCARFTSDGGE